MVVVGHNDHDHHHADDSHLSAVDIKPADEDIDMEEVGVGVVVGIEEVQE